MADDLDPAAVERAARVSDGRDVAAAFRRAYPNLGPEPHAERERQARAALAAARAGEAEPLSVDDCLHERCADLAVDKHSPCRAQRGGEAVGREAVGREAIRDRVAAAESLAQDLSYPAEARTTAMILARDVRTLLAARGDAPVRSVSPEPVREVTPVTRRPSTHACRTAECWHEHATNPDGSSRCLWGSRDGVTPSQRHHRGPYFCDQSHSLHDGPHTFGLRLRLRFLPARAVLPVAAGLAGAVVVWLIRWVTG